MVGQRAGGGRYLVLYGKCQVSRAPVCWALTVPSALSLPEMLAVIISLTWTVWESSAKHRCVVFLLMLTTECHRLCSQSPHCLHKVSGLLKAQTGATRCSLVYQHNDCAYCTLISFFLPVLCHLISPPFQRKKNSLEKQFFPACVIIFKLMSCSWEGV